MFDPVPDWGPIYQSVKSMLLGSRHSAYALKNHLLRARTWRQSPFDTNSSCLLDSAGQCWHFKTISRHFGDCLQSIDDILHYTILSHVRAAKNCNLFTLLEGAILPTESMWYIERNSWSPICRFHGIAHFQTWQVHGLKSVLSDSIRRDIPVMSLFTGMNIG